MKGPRNQRRASEKHPDLSNPSGTGKPRMARPRFPGWGGRAQRGSGAAQHSTAPPKEGKESEKGESECMFLLCMFLILLASVIILFIINYAEKKDYESDLSFKVQQVSNDTYFRVHDINSSLVNAENTNLKNAILCLL